MGKKAKKAPYRGDPVDTIVMDVFNTVCDFFEIQRDEPFVEWHNDAPHRRIYATMEAVYKWWRVERPKLEKKMGEGKLSKNFMKPLPSAKGEPKRYTIQFNKSDRKILDRVRRIEKQIQETDTKWLLKIIRIRACLWD